MIIRIDNKSVNEALNKPLTVVAIIPARGGSERFPRKNLALLGGKPLIVYSIQHALAAEFVNEVYVSTDDSEIARVSQETGAEVCFRPKAISGSNATSETALLHVLDERRVIKGKDPDLVIFLQCTSPLRHPHDLDSAIEKLVDENLDSLLSVCEDKSLFWELSNQLKPINYDYMNRKRDQDSPLQYRENGSFYVFKTDILRTQMNRLGGKIGIYEMEKTHSFQIDHPEDLKIIEALLHLTPPPVSLPEKIECIVFDFDGVMTDNTVLTSQDGLETVRCNRGDGLGLQSLRKLGIPLLVLSTENNPVVKARCLKLDLPYYQGVSNKGGFLRDHLEKNKINPQNVIFIGNDINDIDCLKSVGLPVVVQDAHPMVKHHSKWVLSKNGGQGAVREFCDKILAHLT